MQQTTLFDVGPPAPSPEPDEAKKVVWALTYTRTLVRSHLPNDPLLGTSYCGQAVRVAGKKYFTPEAVAEKRWKEEDNGSVKGDGSDLSFMEVLRTYGPAAFDNEIVWSMQGKNAEVQPLANAKEIALIAERGGTVRDLTPEARIKQTFNRQKGGKAMKAWYESLQGAFAAKRWKIFQDAMRKHVETFGTAYVSRQHVTAQGYHLGSAASNVRSQGNFVDGFPERRVWLDALPHWTWNALESDEYRQQLSERVAAQKAGLSSDEKAEIERKRRATFDAKSEEEKAEIARKISETKSAKSDEEKAEIVRKYKEKMNTKSEEEKAEIVRKISETKSAKSDEEKAEIVRKIRENRNAKSEEQKAEIVRKRKATMATEESKAKRSKIAKDMHANETPEQKEARLKKQKATMSTEESKTKRSKLAKDQAAREKERDPDGRSKRIKADWATRLRDELVRARALPPSPFVKSKKMRETMWEELGTRYMIQKGHIYRVNKDGNMRPARHGRPPRGPGARGLLRE